MFGPVVSFGLGGVATELLGDWSHGIPPLTDSDLHELVRSVRAAPLLLGHRGSAVRSTRRSSRTCWPGWPSSPTTCRSSPCSTLDPVLVGAEGPSVLGGERRGWPGPPPRRPGRAGAARVTRTGSQGRQVQG